MGRHGEDSKGECRRDGELVGLEQRSVNVAEEEWRRDVGRDGAFLVKGSQDLAQESELYPKSCGEPLKGL